MQTGGGGLRVLNLLPAFWFRIHGGGSLPTSSSRGAFSHGDGRSSCLGGQDSFHNVHSFRSAAVLVVLLCFCRFAALGQDTRSAVKPEIEAGPRIDLSAIGYREPSRMDRLSEGEPSESLDFVDSTHVLLTFDRKNLFHRLPGCPPGHQDRLMHAVILEIPSGKVVKDADWYLHDRRRYLWPLGSGKFLLRRLNDLYVVDSSLQERLLMTSPSDLLWVAVTPDASQIIIETVAPTNSRKGPNPPSAAASTEPRFVARFLDAKTLAPLRTLPLNEIVDLNATSKGYVDLVHKGSVWLIRFGPTPDKRRNLARVRSQTVPNVFYSSNNSLVIGRCPAPDCDYSVTSFTVSGHRLWQQHWNRFRIFPEVLRNEDNSRFGVSTVQIDPAAKSSSDQDGVDDPSRPDAHQADVFRQEIQIFETASGNQVMTLGVSPAVLSGQNFSLSPDGRRLAVLQGTGLALFDLLSPSQEEQDKFAALKADVSDLYTLASDTDPSSLLPADAAADDHAADDAPAETPDYASSTGDAGITNPPSSAVEGERDPKASIEIRTGMNAQSSAETVPTFKVSTKAVVVDVVVTDSKGHPVRGLGQRDFRLAEDGNVQDIRYFREFTNSDMRTAAVPAPAGPVALPANVFSNDTQAPDPGAVTLVLLDLLNTPTVDQQYARTQLVKFLQAKPKDSQFALCTLSAGQSRLRLIQGFTPDETLLLSAAKGKKALPQTVGWQESAVQAKNSVNTVSDLAKEGPTSGFQNLLGALQGMQVEQQGTDTEDRVNATVDSLMQLARYLSGIPGRKNIVWLSGSFPISIFVNPGLNNSAAQDRNYSNVIKRVTNLLAEAQIAVYPVDVRGIVGGGPNADSTSFATVPSSPGRSTSTARILTDSSPSAPQGLQELAQQSSEQETLVEVATATGGKAFYNSNGIREAIATAVEQGSNYYTLSYNPTNKIYDGRFRKIRVVLSEKGYSLHYRQGYFADDAKANAKDDLLARSRAAAMQHGSPPSRQILFSAAVVPVEGKKSIDRAKVGEVLWASTKKPKLPSQIEAQHYGIDYSFKGTDVRFIPLTNATFQNVLMLMVASYDNEGRMLSEISHVGVSKLEPAVYKDVLRGELQLHQDVYVPSVAASLRLGIQDQMSNCLGTVEFRLPIPPPPVRQHRRKNPLPEIEPD
jgi:VWFA-related protein